MVVELIFEDKFPVNYEFGLQNWIRAFFAQIYLQVLTETPCHIFDITAKNSMVKPMFCSKSKSDLEILMQTLIRPENDLQLPTEPKFFDQVIFAQNPNLTFRFLFKPLFE